MAAVLAVEGATAAAPALAPGEGGAALLAVAAVLLCLAAALLAVAVLGCCIACCAWLLAVLAVAALL